MRAADSTPVNLAQACAALRDRGDAATMPRRIRRLARELASAPAIDDARSSADRRRCRRSAAITRRGGRERYRLVAHEPYGLYRSVDIGRRCMLDAAGAAVLTTRSTRQCAAMSSRADQKIAIATRRRGSIRRRDDQRIRRPQRLGNRRSVTSGRRSMRRCWMRPELHRLPSTPLLQLTIDDSGTRRACGYSRGHEPGQACDTDRVRNHAVTNARSGVQSSSSQAMRSIDDRSANAGRRRKQRR